MEEETIWRGTSEPCSKRMLSRKEVMQRIDALAAEFLTCLKGGVLMDFIALRRTNDAMRFDKTKKRLHNKEETRLIKLNRGGARKYTAIWLILHTVYELLVDEKTVTQREIYYLHTFFKNQSEADEGILEQRVQDVGSILGVPRTSLNIVGATKGCFTGCIHLKRHDTWRSYDDGDEYQITQQLLYLKTTAIQSNALCIVVIEKDGIFNRLREDNFTKRLPCILVTGRGFPDLATRIFVSLLCEALKVPVFGLSDCNPFGLAIMMTYKLGSARMPLDTHAYGVDLEWIGLRPSTVELLNLPSHAYKSLSPKDKSKAAALLNSPFLESAPDLIEELQMWTKIPSPWKVELEALHLMGFGYLSHFVADRITSSPYQIV